MPSLAKGSSIYWPGQGTHGTTSTVQAQDLPTPIIINQDMAHSEGPGTSDESTRGRVSDSVVPPPSLAYPPSSPVSNPLCCRPYSTVPISTPDSQTSINPTTSTSQTVTTTSISTSSKHKHSVLNQLLLSAKKQCTSGMTGTIVLNGIKESLDAFNNTLGQSLLMWLDCMRADTSPECWVKVMELFQENEYYLTDDCIVAFIDLFWADVTATDAYIVLKRDSLRKAWVQQQMKELSFPVNSWSYLFPSILSVLMYVDVQYLLFFGRYESVWYHSCWYSS